MLTTTRFEQNAYRLAAAAITLTGAARIALPQEPAEDQYRVLPDSVQGLTVYRLADRTGAALDTYRTRSGAAHAARLLNTGAGRYAPHATRGCRVQPHAPDAPAPLLTRPAQTH